MPVRILKEHFDLDKNQSNLIIIACLTFIFQAICFYFMSHETFQIKWCILCFIFAFAYNITYFKFFISTN